MLTNLVTEESIFTTNSAVQARFAACAELLRAQAADSVKDSARLGVLAVEVFLVISSKMVLIAQSLARMVCWELCAGIRRISTKCSCMVSLS